MIRHRWTVVCLTLISWLLVTHPPTVRAEMELKLMRGANESEATTEVKIICIKDPKEYCHGKADGTQFSDGCRECQCARNDAFCKTAGCSLYVPPNTNPEMYCAKILDENRKRGVMGQMAKPASLPDRPDADLPGTELNDKPTKSETNIHGLKNSSHEYLLLPPFHHKRHPMDNSEHHERAPDFPRRPDPHRMRPRMPPHPLHNEHRFSRDSAPMQHRPPHADDNFGFRKQKDSFWQKPMMKPLDHIDMPHPAEDNSKQGHQQEPPIKEPDLPSERPSNDALSDTLAKKKAVKDPFKLLRDLFVPTNDKKSSRDSNTKLTDGLDNMKEKAQQNQRIRDSKSDGTKRKNARSSEKNKSEKKIDRTGPMDNLDHNFGSIMRKHQEEPERLMIINELPFGDRFDDVEQKHERILNRPPPFPFPPHAGQPQPFDHQRHHADVHHEGLRELVGHPGDPKPAGEHPNLVELREPIMPPHTGPRARIDHGEPFTGINHGISPDRLHSPGDRKPADGLEGPFSNNEPKLLSHTGPHEHLDREKIRRFDDNHPNGLPERNGPPDGHHALGKHLANREHMIDRAQQHLFGPPMAHMERMADHKPINPSEMRHHEIMWRNKHRLNDEPQIDRPFEFYNRKSLKPFHPVDIRGPHPLEGPMIFTRLRESHLDPTVNEYDKRDKNNSIGQQDSKRPGNNITFVVTKPKKLRGETSVKSFVPTSALDKSNDVDQPYEVQMYDIPHKESRAERISRKLDLIQYKLDRYRSKLDTCEAYRKQYRQALRSYLDHSYNSANLMRSMLPSIVPLIFAPHWWNQPI